MISVIRSACWLSTELAVHRYLMSCADGRWDGFEKAQRHDELCTYYVAVFRGCSKQDVRQRYEADWDAVHDETQKLTDSLDEVIGFPLAGVPDYDALAPKFFEHFHRLALNALGVSVDVKHNDDIRSYARYLLQDVAEESGFYEGVRWAEREYGIVTKENE